MATGRYSKPRPKCHTGAIPHDTSLTATIAAGLGLGFVFGLLAARFHLPPLLGYLLAGVAIGPFTPGYVADGDMAHQLSEIGVTLLMFGVGLHFSIRDLLAVRKIALPGAVAQLAAATLMGALVCRVWGWSWGAGIVFGLSLSVASTVVLLRALGERRELDTVNGRVAVGWLIVEDLATVVALVALPALAIPLGGKPLAEGGTGNVALDLGFTLLKVSAFVAGMLVIGKKLIPRVLGRAARMRSRELFTLGVLAVALGIAFGASALFGVSPALGAFFAGVVISESDLSHQAAAETLPLQEAFTVLFFVSVGMLFDPAVLVSNPVFVVIALLVVIVGKSLASAFIVLLFRYPVATALTISASLAQIGEFSFILVALGTHLEILPAAAQSIVVAVAILSISLNPLIFRTIAPIDRWLRARPRLLSLFELEAPQSDLSPNPDLLQGHVVMIGYGRVGAMIGEALDQCQVAYVVVEQDRNVVEELRRQGQRAIFGDAARAGVLAQSSLEYARLLIIVTPDKSHAKEILDHAWKVNPDIDTCVRSHSFSQTAYFREIGVSRTFMGEASLALEMGQYALASVGVEEEEVERVVAEIRAGIAARVL